ncbi:MAG: hypothetical protein JEZ05_03995 [Tenericutes bacterium]|nr:hypothetical protein [Mycoplasmatota bacterium]
MDQWFNQLFDIIGRQIESKKVDMLLPEIYSELDIVARKENIIELHEIYEFVNEVNPVKTQDPDYNKLAHDKLKKEILKRHVMLRDMSILSHDLEELLQTHNTKAINKFINNWKESKFVFNYLEEIVFNSKKPKKAARPEDVQRTVKINIPKKIIEPVLDVEKEKPVPKPKAVVKEAPKKEVKPDPLPRPKIEPKKEVIHEAFLEPEIEPKKEVFIEPVKEPEPEIKEIVETKVVEEKTIKVISKPIIQKKPEPIKKQRKEKKEKVIESFPTKKVSKSSFIEPDEVIIKPKFDRDLPTPNDQTETQDPTLEKPAEVHVERDPYEKIFNCVSILSSKYSMLVNVEMLKKLTNPKPNFSRFLLQFIDEQDRNARFFIELIKVLTEYNLEDIVSQIIEKSFKIKKLLTFNIGLFNIEDFQTKSELLDIVKNQDFDFIKMSLYERSLRQFIDSLQAKDTTTEDIKKRTLEISRFAPLLIQTFYSADALSFFKINLLDKNDRIVEPGQISQLYWAMMLSTAVTVYVIRTKHSDYIDSMNCVADFANQLIKESSNSSIRLATKILASNYIRRIYKMATDLPDYAEWWDRYKDDLLDTKRKALALLNPMD